MPQGQKISQDIINQVTEQLKSGKSALKVVRDCKVSTGTVYRIKNELNNKGLIKSTSKAQKPKAKSARKPRAVTVTKQAPTVETVSKNTSVVETRATKAIRSEITDRQKEIAKWEKMIESKRNEIKSLESTLTILSQ